MDLVINGTRQTVDDAICVTRLLDLLAVDPSRVAVEVNRELVTRKSFDDTRLADGDAVEVVTFVGGG